MPTLPAEVFDDVRQLPADWDIPACGNLFLTRHYLTALHDSTPQNMMLHYILVRRGTEPVAVAVSQFLDMSHVRSFGERDNCLKTKIRTVAFRRFAANVLILGNNMLTGQHAFCYTRDTDRPEVILSIEKALREIKDRLKKIGKRPHLTIWKDFTPALMKDFSAPVFDGFFRFSTQPNMVFSIPAEWNCEADYVLALNKKYRDQYKRARKKAAILEKRRLSFQEIIEKRDRINQLYHNVAANAPFNTFYLHEDHFIELKRNLTDRFLVYGYFLGEKLVGFNTIIRNGSDLDTYFLGYDEAAQREHMLYLNMLYDMIGYSAKNGFRKIVFARTALEIKSSVGAKPEAMYGLIRHENSYINRQIHRLFGYFEPDVPWTERHPFKDLAPQPSTASEESQFQSG